jgi:hypothetical protein
MPVTVQINAHPAEPWPKSKASSASQLLEHASPRHYRRCQKIIQTSFDTAQLDSSHISASDNGFVWAAYHAYSTHHHLVIRPEDIWFAVLSQLSFYINAHAEELRSFFVAHDGRKELTTLSYVADFGALALQMTEQIAKNVVDENLKDWVMPSFSTTTHHDKVIGAILFMGSMQKYFSYSMGITCGLPAVTLLGEAEDWKDILRRLDMIDQLGEEPTQFARMLRPVLQHFILTIEDPTNEQVKPFWNGIAHFNGLFSGTDYLTGWLMAFSYWTEKGHANRCSPENRRFGDVDYPRIDIDAITTGLASVPVLVNDNGHEFSATMVAGSVGILARGEISQLSETEGVPRPDHAASSAVNTASTATSGEVGLTADLTTVQAVTGWWMYEDESAEAIQVREAEKKRLREELSTYWEEMLSDDVKHERRKYLRRQRRRLDELEAF